MVRSNMALSDSIKVRLREGQTLVYAAQAEQRGVGIAAYIRDRLDQTDRIDDELASIRAAMIDMGETMDELRDQLAERSVAPAEDQLLLRTTTDSQTKNMVTSEVERQGLKPFRIPGPPTRNR